MTLVLARRRLRLLVTNVHTNLNMMLRVCSSRSIESSKFCKLATCDRNYFYRLDKTKNFLHSKGKHQQNEETFCRMTKYFKNQIKKEISKYLRKSIQQQENIILKLSKAYERTFLNRRHHIG